MLVLPGDRQSFGQDRQRPCLASFPERSSFIRMNPVSHDHFREGNRGSEAPYFPKLD